MKMIKLLTYFTLLLCVGFTTVSCLDDDNAEETYLSYGFFPASDVTFSADSIGTVSQATNIHVTFSLTGNCQDFMEFKTLTTSTSTSRHIGAFGSQQNNAACTNEIRTVTKTYKFIPTVAGENTIKVWAGKNSSNEDVYIEKTIVIPAA